MQILEHEMYARELTEKNMSVLCKKDKKKAYYKLVLTLLENNFVVTAFVSPQKKTAFLQIRSNKENSYPVLFDLWITNEIFRIKEIIARLELGTVVQLCKLLRGNREKIRKIDREESNGLGQKAKNKGKAKVLRGKTRQVVSSSGRKTVHNRVQASRGKAKASASKRNKATKGARV